MLSEKGDQRSKETTFANQLKLDFKVNYANWDTVHTKASIKHAKKKAEL